MKAKQFDEKFESGESIIEHLDIEKAKRMNLEPRRVNVDFPAWMVDSLDKQASVRGVTRQSLIKLWLADRLEQR